MTAGYKPTDEDGLAEAWGEADHAALTAAPTPPEQAKCLTCNGHGLIGGHMQDGSGYAEGCPDCNPQTAASSLQPVCRYISEVLAGDAASGEKNIARTIMHLLPLEQAALGTHPQPAVPEDVAEALRDGLSVCRSVSTCRDRKIVRDGVTLYAQTEEWCRWLEDEVGPKIETALEHIDAARAAGGA